MHAESTDDIKIYRFPFLRYNLNVKQPLETVFKEKHGVWDPMPEFTITSPYVDSRVPCTLGTPMPESTLSHSQGLIIWPQIQAANMF